MISEYISLARCWITECAEQERVLGGKKAIDGCWHLIFQSFAVLWTQRNAAAAASFCSCKILPLGTGLASDTRTFQQLAAGGGLVSMQDQVPGSPFLLVQLGVGAARGGRLGIQAGFRRCLASGGARGGRGCASCSCAAAGFASESVCVCHHKTEKKGKLRSAWHCECSCCPAGMLLPRDVFPWSARVVAVKTQVILRTR